MTIGARPSPWILGAQTGARHGASVGGRTAAEIRSHAAQRPRRPRRWTIGSRGMMGALDDIHAVTRRSGDVAGGVEEAKLLARARRGGLVRRERNRPFGGLACAADARASSGKDLKSGWPRGSPSGWWTPFPSLLPDARRLHRETARARREAGREAAARRLVEAAATGGFRVAPPRPGARSRPVDNPGGVGDLPCDTAGERRRGRKADDRSREAGSDRRTSRRAVGIGRGGRTRRIALRITVESDVGPVVLAAFAGMFEARGHDDATSRNEALEGSAETLPRCRARSIRNALRVEPRPRDRGRRRKHRRRGAHPEAIEERNVSVCGPTTRGSRRRAAPPSDGEVRERQRLPAADAARCGGQRLPGGEEHAPWARRVGAASSRGDRRRAITRRGAVWLPLRCAQPCETDRARLDQPAASPVRRRRRSGRR